MVAAETVQAPQATVDELATLAKTWAETTLIGLYLVSAGRFLWGNAQFSRDTGYSAAALLGRRSMDLIHPEDRDGVRAHAIAMLEGQRTSPYEYRYRSATGETRWALETVASVTLGGERATLGNFMQISERKRLEEQLTHQAFHDPLTGLANRALLLDRLTQALASRARTGDAVAALYLDLDDFKAVNDAHGHQTGDALLRAVTQRLQQSLRAADTLGRLGGDEFAVVVTGASATGEAEGLGRRIAAALAEPFILGGHAIRSAVSCGIAVAAGNEDAEALLCRADLALYQAKAQGKGRAVLARVAPGDNP